MTLSARVVTGPQKADICGELGRVPTGRHTRPKAIRIRVAGVRVQQVCLGPGTGLVTRRGPAPRHGRISHITKVLPSHPPASPHRRFLTAPDRPYFPRSEHPSPHRHRRAPMADTTLMDKLVSLCKRRGFVFQSSEIYGGLGSVWDYGPLGVELKKNVKDRWWRAMVHARDDIEGLDAAILMHPRVWEASGHVAGFTDPLVDCRHCKNRFRADDPRIKGTPGPAGRAVPRVRQQGDAHRAAAVQPHVQDLHGAGRGAGGGGLPAARDRAGDLRQLPERAAELAPADSLRHRPDRQGVPQRDHARATSSSGPASSSRWRCSSS